MSTSDHRADDNLFRLYQALLSETDIPDLSAYDPLGTWMEVALEMHAMRVRDGVAGVKAYARGFNNLKEKTEEVKRLIRVLSGSPPDEDAEQKPARRIRFLPLSEFLNREAQQWLIPDILPRDGLALVYGESGGYKTFLVMDWSFSLATGTPWLGRHVAHGPVAYIVAEGGYGVGKRAQAWLVHHQRFFRTREELDQQVPVRLYDESIILQEPASVAELLTALQEDFPDEPPLMVVIDTLSRCSPGAEEVSNTDMARVLASADMVRQQFHCTVLIVHHEGKDKDRGPRGASALLANIETAILVTPDGDTTKVESIKAKDAPKFKPIRLEALEVRFGAHPDEASLVLVPRLATEEEGEEQPRMTETEASMYALLVKAGRPLTYTEWREAGKEAQLNNRLIEQAIASLRKKGLVQQTEKRGPYSLVQDESVLTQPSAPTDESTTAD